MEFVQEGDSVPHLLIPRLIALHQAGLFPFERLVGYYDLAELNRAVADFEQGKVIKAIIRMPSVSAATSPTSAVARAMTV